MYNLMNSPAGPLGQAGQSSASSQPSGLFSNAGPSFNNFGRGIDSFTNSLHGKLQGLMSKLFPGPTGGMPTDQPQDPNVQAQAPMANGAQSIFGSPQAGQQQGSPMVGPEATPATQTSPVSPNGGSGVFGAPGAPQGGVLSQFMRP